MLVEEGDIRLYVADGKRQVVAVTHVDAVETSPHSDAVSLSDATGKRQQEDNDSQQMFHCTKISK
jgi:hypothetical protein